MPLKKASVNENATIPDTYKVEEVPETIKRDRWDRPLIKLRDGAGEKAYTRASTLGKAIEDTYHLDLWKQRCVAFGMSRRPDLVATAASIETNEGKDRGPLQEVCAKAHEAAKGDAGANIGTALHKLSERKDKGEDLSWLPPVIGEAMDYYAELMSYVRVLATEVFVVCDELEAAGSFDRVVELLVDLEFNMDGQTTVIPRGTVLVVDLKGLALDTKIPTPSGWTTMGEVKLGDQVIGSDGRPCTVTAKSGVKQIGTYIVTFDDGEQITCDKEHLWWVKTGRGVKEAREQVINVEDMRETLFRYGQRQHRVPVAGSLELPNADLPIDPYLFGCWLGDGKMTGGEITKDDGLFDGLESDGHQLGVRQVDSRSGIITRTVLGLRTALIAAGLIGHRIIPAEYLRASHAQRLALLRGLMDTDGTWNIARERAVFTSTDKGLATQVKELALTLGLKPQFNSWAANGYGVTTTAYGVEFLPIDFNPFRLPRKANRVTWNKNEAMARHRIVQSVEPGPDVKTACIAVDSPNHTYLCGEGLVPTHNTGKLASAKYWGADYGAQQTVYANGTPYLAGRGRVPWPEVLGEDVEPSKEWALILHVPGDSPSDAGFVLVDLEIGAEMAGLAVEVREMRRRKGLMRDAYPVVEKTIDEAEPAQVVRTKIIAAITRAENEETLWEIADYAIYENVWDDHCKRAAQVKQRAFDAVAE